ncbi:MAG: hypothetical protein AAF739_02820 [Pseudomonadota bacterium]
MSYQFRRIGRKFLKLRWVPARIAFAIASLFAPKVTVKDGSRTYTFVTTSFESYQRARSMLSKETDTLK